MPIEKTPVRTVQVDYRCDACWEGHYRPTGMQLTTYPPQYPHRCNACDAHKNLTCTYPHIAYEPETTT